MSKTVKQLLSIIALCAYVVLVGCGTRGPLYIPEQRYPQEVQDNASDKVPTNTPKVAPTNQSTY